MTLVCLKLLQLPASAFDCVLSQHYQVWCEPMQQQRQQQQQRDSFLRQNFFALSHLHPPATIVGERCST